MSPAKTARPALPLRSPLCKVRLFTKTIRIIHTSIWLQQYTVTIKEILFRRVVLPHFQPCRRPINGNMIPFLFPLSNRKASADTGAFPFYTRSAKKEGRSLLTAPLQCPPVYIKYEIRFHTLRPMMSAPTMPRSGRTGIFLHNQAAKGAAMTPPTTRPSIICQ